MTPLFFTINIFTGLYSYTQEEVLYAKMVKRSIKRNEGEKCARECKTGDCNPGC